MVCKTLFLKHLHAPKMLTNELYSSPFMKKIIIGHCNMFILKLLQNAVKFLKSIHFRVTISEITNNCIALEFFFKQLWFKDNGLEKVVHF